MVGSKVSRRNQEKEIESSLFGVTVVMDALSTLSMHCNALLIISVGTVFIQHVSGLLILVRLRTVRFNPHFPHLLDCNPPGQSKDWLLIHALHDSSNTFRRLPSLFEKCCAKLGSDLCAGQTMDCSSSSFEHNVHVLYTTIIELG